jgi:CII-binding regulator of phage lambda lysogenization HflD
MERRCPPKILGPPGTMEFCDGTMEFCDDDTEEKVEASGELVATLKQRITALEEQITEFHLAIYDQKDDFGMLCKVTTSKLKRFAKTLGDPSLYNAPSP